MDDSRMLLNRRTGYAVIVLMYLAIQDQRTVTISEVSRQLRISRNNLTKICHHLVRLGYVHSVRGKGGGIRLARAADSIKLRDIVVQTEATFEIIDCRKRLCPLAGSCLLKEALMESRDGFLEVLSCYTIADLVRNKVDLLKLLDPNAA